MVYFPTPEETRYLQRGLLAEARQHAVLDELRGWNWPAPPVRPIYARPLDLPEIGGGVCPTGRDVYLRGVEGLPPMVPAPVAEGSLLKAALASVLREAKALILRYGVEAPGHLERMVEEAHQRIDEGGTPIDPDEQRRQDLWRLRAFEARRVLERVVDVLAVVGPLGADALAALALPVDVDVPLNGRFLGLRDRVMVDAISFRDGVVYSLGFGEPSERERLMTAGLALVAESVFERPFDIGCVVYPKLVEGRVEVRRDLHVIGDELRQIFIEERDDRMHLVEVARDPGLPAQCPVSCPYLRVCRPALEELPGGAERRVSANRVAVGGTRGARSEAEG